MLISGLWTVMRYESGYLSKDLVLLLRVYREI